MITLYFTTSGVCSHVTASSHDITVIPIYVISNSLVTRTFLNIAYKLYMLYRGKLWKQQTLADSLQIHNHLVKDELFSTQQSKILAVMSAWFAAGKLYTKHHKLYAMGST